MLCLVLVLMMLVVVRVTVIVFILFVSVDRPFVDGEFHPLNLLPLLPVEVKVKVAKRKLREFPLQRGGLDAEIYKSADHHVAADSGDAVEKECAH
jgi:hypothetical protein